MSHPYLVFLVLARDSMSPAHVSKTTRVAVKTSPSRKQQGDESNDWAGEDRVGNGASRCDNENVGHQGAHQGKCRRKAMRAARHRVAVDGRTNHFRPRAATAAPVRAALPTSVLCEPTSTPSTTYLVVAQIVVCEFGVCVECSVCVCVCVLDWVTLRVGVAY